jgi:hypothetical protein
MGIPCSGLRDDMQLLHAASSPVSASMDSDAPHSEDLKIPGKCNHILNSGNQLDNKRVDSKNGCMLDREASDW